MASIQHGISSPPLPTPQNEIWAGAICYAVARGAVHRHKAPARLGWRQGHLLRGQPDLWPMAEASFARRSTCFGERWALGAKRLTRTVKRFTVTAKRCTRSAKRWTWSAERLALNAQRWPPRGKRSTKFRGFPCLGDAIHPRRGPPACARQSGSGAGTRRASLGWRTCAALGGSGPR